MEYLLKNEAKKYGDRLQIIPVKHLEDLRRELEKFKNSEKLNGFQQWIINDLYHYEIPDTGFEVKSIILIAVYHPFCADVEMSYKGKLYRTRSLVMADFNKARSYLSELLSLHNFHAYEYDNLPLKRLAVQCGLAEYGRNNITYVDGFGSNISYLAFYTDVPCEKDEWREQCVSKRCEHCKVCLNSCPTGAILTNRFLIDNEKCLSCMNERDGEFPDWLPENVHHMLYDCLKCQEKCPMNVSASRDTIGPVRFTEEETNMLLQGMGPENFTKEFMVKADKLGLFAWSQGLARNIRAIIKAADL